MSIVFASTSTSGPGQTRPRHISLMPGCRRLHEAIMLPINNTSTDSMPKNSKAISWSLAHSATNHDRHTRIYQGTVLYRTEELPPADPGACAMRRASKLYCEGKYQAPSPPPASAHAHIRKADTRGYGTLFEMADVVEKGGCAKDMEKSP